MSRSRRKTPIAGITTAESDKAFKVAEHRRERRTVNAALNTAEDLPHTKLFGNPWASEKDGKRLFDPTRHPASMRK
jgi:hypothetical protein